MEASLLQKQLCWQHVDLDIQEILEGLRELFVDPNMAHQALMQLQQCRMGTRKATEFFTEFEELASMAGFDVTKDPPHMLDILEHALPREWVQLWHDMNVIPITY